MKKILIVAYFFPPFGGVGAFRIRKLVKYFQKKGWEITVLTVKDKYYDENSIDNDSLKDIPEDVKIIRTKRIKEVTKFKEQGLYWIGSLFVEQFKILKKEKFDYVFYTGGPFIHFILAPIMKNIFSQKYILDFRDPWLLTPYNKSKLRKIIAQILEPYCVEKASYVINVTCDATNMYKKHYSKIKNEKFITIENGYDPEDFINVKVNSTLGNNNIIYAGKLGNFRNVNPFLEALKKYNENNSEKLKFIHIGTEEKSILDFMENNKDSEEYIINLGFLPYHKTLEYIKGARYCLLISGGHPYEPTTKIYDYIALNKNILCINDTQYGYLYEVMNRYNKSIISNNNTNEISEKLNILINSISDKNLSEINTDEFNRKKIFDKLNRILI